MNIYNSVGRDVSQIMAPVTRDVSQIMAPVTCVILLRSGFKAGWKVPYVGVLAGVL